MELKIIRMKQQIIEILKAHAECDTEFTSYVMSNRFKDVAEKIDKMINGSEVEQHMNDINKKYEECGCTSDYICTSCHEL